MLWISARGRLWLPIISGVAFLSFGCSGSSSNRSTDGGSVGGYASDGAVGTGTGGDGGATGSGGAGAGGTAGASQPLNVGLILVDVDDMNGAHFEAGFNEYQAGGAAMVPMATQGCQVTQGPLTAGPAPQYTSVSAGTLSVAGGGAPIVLMMNDVQRLDGGPQIQYAQSGSATASPGATLTIAGTGATAPPFSIAVSVPDAITMTQPTAAVGSTAPWVVSRSADLSFAWTGGGIGTVNISVAQFANNALVAVVCSFPESAGGGVIPAALLSYLTPTAELGDAGVLGNSTSVSVGTSSSDSTMVGDWTIGVLAQGPIANVPPGTVTLTQ